MNGSLKKQNTFYNYFPTPEYLTLSTSGIALSDDSIHFIQLRHGLWSTGLKFSRHEKITLPKDTVESGFVNSAEKLAEALKDLSKRHGLSFARATLPEERAYVFTASIDRVPSEGLRDAVAFIIEENAPVTLANSIFDFDVLDTVEEGKIRVVVSVISKKVVDYYLQVFSAAGLTPVSFDIESQAIARAVVPKGDRVAQLILNLGRDKTGFYVVEDEVVQFTTTLPYGSDGGGRSHIDDLKTELKKIFTFWSARSKVGFAERKIEKIILCGAASLDYGYVSEFMADIPEPYDWADPWGNISPSPKKLPPELVRDTLEYVSAVGLAIPHPHRTYV